MVKPNNINSNYSLNNNNNISKNKVGSKINNNSNNKHSNNINNSNNKKVSTHHMKPLSTYNGHGAGKMNSVKINEEKEQINNKRLQVSCLSNRYPAPNTIR